MLRQSLFSTLTLFFVQVSSLVGQFVPGFAYPNPAGLPTTGPYGGPVQQWPVRTQQQQQLPGSWPPPPAQQQLPGYLGGPQQQLPFGFPLPEGSTSPVLLGGQPRMVSMHSNVHGICFSDGGGGISNQHLPSCGARSRRGSGPASKNSV